ncbi:MAG: CocE/NonD family hydrolase [Planctomycetota bacterium]|jgi:putative CocE/NonD family hydrolase
MNKSMSPTRKAVRILRILCILVLALAYTFDAVAAEPPSPPVYGVRVEEVWIPMKDGVRLATNLYMPEGSQPGEKFPPLLMYLPYRKDSLAVFHYEVMGYFARRGYVGVAVDVRGSGRSEGLLPHTEYSEQEHKDGIEVIAWLAQQPWSNGNVGMFGISYGGFNAIQIAMLHPPDLKAILPMMATDDLYITDQFCDGIMHVDEYELAIDLSIAKPRAPDYPLDEETLSRRFDRTPWVLGWLREQRDGPFWRRASLRPNYDKIEIPTFMIGGWLDGYRDSISRMLEHMTAPVKAILGPWSHYMPHDAVPGPRIEWRHEAVRWWDYWLKGRDTGIMDEPPFAVYVRHWYPPAETLADALKDIPGEWRTEEGWPLERIEHRTFYPQANQTLALSPPKPAVHDLKYVPSVGAVAGFWWGDLRPDQRPADGFSLVYDTEPLDEDLEILGMPRAVLHASATAPLAHWFVRLSDVAPDGSVTLVTGAALNGAQRESRSKPSALVPGVVYPLEIELHCTSWVFPRGHKVRMAISNALFPMFWPTPYPMTTSLYLGGARDTRLILPAVPHEERPRPQFLLPENVDPAANSGGGSFPGQWWTIQRDIVRRSTTIEWRGGNERLVYSVQDDRPDLASVHGEVESWVHLDNRVLNWRGRLDVTSDLNNFYYRWERKLLLNGQPLREKVWQETIPRDHQ